MESKSKSHDDLAAIKSIMERSTRFLSLSGISGVFTGLVALAGASIAYFIVLEGRTGNDYLMSLPDEKIRSIQTNLVVIAVIVLLLAVGIAFELSRRKAAKQGIKIWSPASRRMLLNLLVPLVSGGLFIIIMFLDGLFSLIIPSMLIFYGLALVNAGKFTYSEIFYLGICEIVTGLAAALLPRYGLFLWVFGFGILHIFYGLVMYRKYES